MLREEPLALGALGDGRPRLELLGSDLERDEGARQHIVISVRIGRRARFGGQDDELVAVLRVGK